MGAGMVAGLSSGYVQGQQQAQERMLQKNYLDLAQKKFKLEDQNAQLEQQKTQLFINKMATDETFRKNFLKQNYPDIYKNMYPMEADQSTGMSSAGNTQDMVPTPQGIMPRNYTGNPLISASANASSAPAPQQANVPANPNASSSGGMSLTDFGKQRIAFGGVEALANPQHTMTSQGLMNLDTGATIPGTAPMGTQEEGLLSAASHTMGAKDANGKPLPWSQVVQQYPDIAQKAYMQIENLKATINANKVAQAFSIRSEEQLKVMDQKFGTMADNAVKTGILPTAGINNKDFIAVVQNRYPNADVANMQLNQKYKQLASRQLGQINGVLPRIDDLEKKFAENKIGSGEVRVFNEIKNTILDNLGDPSITDVNSNRNSVVLEALRAQTGSSQMSDYRAKLETSQISANMSPEQKVVAIQNLRAGLLSLKNAYMTNPYPSVVDPSRDPKGNPLPIKPNAQASPNNQPAGINVGSKIELPGGIKVTRTK